MERSAGRMSLETYQKIIEHLGKDIFFMLIYHQGEPYINKNFFKFVEIAKQNNIYVTTSRGDGGVFWGVDDISIGTY